jgi:alkanesulfonate monooxygenase SsuD/methylene tetrahydromethanopterin reductase-like flavin-dependent oxidoreductase (luciferase family)
MGFTDAARAIRAALARNDIPGMLSAVTDEMVAALTVAGTPDEVRRQLGQFAGLVDTVILCSPYFAGDLEAVQANHQAMIEMLRTM